jgi:hypothetical protein
VCISIWKYGTIKKSPYDSLMGIFGGLYIGFGSRSIRVLWDESQYSQCMSLGYVTELIISAIVIVVVYRLLLAMVKWSIIEYKNHLKHEQSNITDYENRSDG